MIRAKLPAAISALAQTQLPPTAWINGAAANAPMLAGETPPVGMNLFIAAMRLHKPLMKLAAASLVLMGLMLGILVLITYWPALSLSLPAWLAR